MAPLGRTREEQKGEESAQADSLPVFFSLFSFFSFFLSLFTTEESELSELSAFSELSALAPPQSGRAASEVGSVAAIPGTATSTFTHTTCNSREIFMASS